MPYTNHFKKEDKQKALHYRSEMEKYFRLYMTCLDKGEFKKSKMYLDQFIDLKNEIDRMRREKVTIDGANQELSDRELQLRRDYF